MRIVIYVLISFFLTLMVFAENCGENQYCPSGKKYPYIMCNLKAKCSSNPTLENSPEVISTPFPVCLKLSTSQNGRGPEKIKMTVINNETGNYEVEVYSRSELENPVSGDIDCAENAWNCICGKEDEQCKCEIDIFFTTNMEDISGDPYSTKATSHISKYNVDNHCDVLCNDNQFGNEYASNIAINNTNQFKRLRNGKVTNWFYNNSMWDEAKKVFESSSSKEYALHNLCDVLQHELGHIYGLDHFDVYCPEEHNSGQMNSKDKPNQPYEGLSDDDKCAFMKLYCNNLVPVKEYPTENTGIKNYPNPATYELNIEFAVSSSIENVKVQIYDIYGNFIGEFYNKKLIQGSYKTRINIGSFLKGVYIYKISMGGNTDIINKFIKTE